ncbi:uncharacterized protein LOC119670226 [Teleopsis dalmanni]|uniref:uncharacterized protein LOC119670225 n=1 Tax=Teleopsis dalmanni TaxID=139649 RepID=UPI0018CFD037|nr:uncharacterized protein LOC119670225 [Teleopsis dalmanni]XP_037936331.1 uncharacterized protein LOC119670226 [Teleopsis dalmanni]
MTKIFPKCGFLETVKNSSELCDEFRKLLDSSLSFEEYISLLATSAIIYVLAETKTLRDILKTGLLEEIISRIQLKHAGPTQAMCQEIFRALQYQSLDAYPNIITFALALPLEYPTSVAIHLCLASACLYKCINFSNYKWKAKFINFHSLIKYMDLVDDDIFLGGDKSVYFCYFLKAMSALLLIILFNGDHQELILMGYSPYITYNVQDLRKLILWFLRLLVKMSSLNTENHYASACHYQLTAIMNSSILERIQFVEYEMCKESNA